MNLKSPKIETFWTEAVGFGKVCLKMGQCCLNSGMV